MLYSLIMEINKEDTHMKNTSCTHHRSAVRYPNAASGSYKLNRILDYLLTGATTFGIVTAILFLVTL